MYDQDSAIKCMTKIVWLCVVDFSEITAKHASFRKSSPTHLIKGFTFCLTVLVVFLRVSSFRKCVLLYNVMFIPNGRHMVTKLNYSVTHGSKERHKKQIYKSTLQIQRQHFLINLRMLYVHRPIISWGYDVILANKSSYPRVTKFL